MIKKSVMRYPHLLVIRGKAALGVGCVTMHSLPDVPPWVLMEVARELLKSGDHGYGMLGVYIAFAPDRGVSLDARGEKRDSTLVPGHQFSHPAAWGGMPEFPDWPPTSPLATEIYR